MKKYFTLILVAIFSLVAVSCDSRNDDVIVQDNDTYSKVLDITMLIFLIIQPMDILLAEVLQNPS